MASATVPVRIINSRGVATTVHRRADSPTGPSSRPIPAPAVKNRNPVPDWEPVTLDPSALWQRTLANAVRNASTSERIRQSMHAGLHPKVLEMLPALTEGEMALQFTAALNDAIEVRSFRTMNNLAAYLGALESLPEDESEGRFLTMALIGEDERGEDGPDFIRDPHLIPSYRVLIETMRSPANASLRQHITRPGRKKGTLGRRFIRFVHDGLAELILERPDRVDDILALVNDRGSFERGLIVNALDSGVATGSGWL